MAQFWRPIGGMSTLALNANAPCNQVTCLTYDDRSRQLTGSRFSPMMHRITVLFLELPDRVGV